MRPLDGTEELRRRNGATGADVLSGGPDCGPGDDTAIVDAREDGVLDCESVQSP